LSSLFSSDRSSEAALQGADRSGGVGARCRAAFLNFGAASDAFRSGIFPRKLRSQFGAAITAKVAKNRHQPSIKPAISTLRIPFHWIGSNLRHFAHAQSIGKTLNSF
jgi:hypothetical protein